MVLNFAAAATFRGGLACRSGLTAAAHLHGWLQHAQTSGLGMQGRWLPAACQLPAGASPAPDAGDQSHLSVSGAAFCSMATPKGFGGCSCLIPLSALPIYQGPSCLRNARQCCLCYAFGCLSKHCMGRCCNADAESEPAAGRGLQAAHSAHARMQRPPTSLPASNGGKAQVCPLLAPGPACQTAACTSAQALSTCATLGLAGLPPAELGTSRGLLWMRLVGSCGKCCISRARRQSSAARCIRSLHSGRAIQWRGAGGPAVCSRPHVPRSSHKVQEAKTQGAGSRG